MKIRHGLAGARLVFPKAAISLFFASYPLTRLRFASKLNYSIFLKGVVSMAFVDEIFGINVFNDSVMRKRLPKETYKTLHKTIDQGRRLDPQAPSVVANAMKD